MLGWFLRGLAMGAADIVPGVSGGTIAFITGIYERLITAISAFDHRLFSVWRTKGWAGVWQAIDGTFLVVLFAGILTSVASLAHLINWMLEQHAIMLWSFFFGLILGSVFLIRAAMKAPGLTTYMAILSGALMAYAITMMAPSQIPLTNLNLFLAGMIAICAMILPGVSGSFLLLVMGMYAHVIGAIKGFDIALLAVFAGGCIVGLMGFSHILKWLLKAYHDLTLALLTGFMLGSLNKVWPWKQVLEYRINSKGEPVPLIERNILPEHYEQLTGQSSQLLLAIILFVLGVGLVVLMDRYQKVQNRKV